MENERLQQRLTELRKRAPELPSIPSSSAVPSMYTPLSIQGPRSYTAPLSIVNSGAGEMAQPYYPVSATCLGGYSSMMPSPVSGTLDSSNATPYATMFSANPGKDEDVSDEGSRKKKVKTSLSWLPHLTSNSPAQKIVWQ